MPIQINLLAEAHALEDQRRRDPVKRVILAGLVLVVLILVWSSSLLVQTIVAKGNVNRLESDLNSRTNEYGQILENQRQVVTDLKKLSALNRLATNRFLIGNLMQALQTTTVPNVQLVRLHLSQNYVLKKAVKPKRRGQHLKPATATESIVLTLDAKDCSPTPGDGVAKYQKTLSQAPFFLRALGGPGGFRLTRLGAPQSDAEGRPFVLFTLEARFPSQTR